MRARSKRPLLLAATLVVLAVAAAGCGGASGTTQADSTEAPAFDRAFIDGMIPHHEQAIEMATDAKAAGLSEPVLVGIADSIISSQKSEITRMAEWRHDWYGSSEVDPTGSDDLGLSMDQMGMMGERMDFTSEADVNAAFASAMIDHHEGAVAMARLALRRAQHDEVKALATDIIAAQEGEIDEMKPFAGAGGHDMGGMG